MFLCTYLSLYLSFLLWDIFLRLSYFCYLFATSTPLAGIVNFQAPRRKSSMLSKLFVVFLGWMRAFEKMYLRASKRREKDESPEKTFYKGFGVDWFRNICAWGDCSSFRKQWKAAAKAGNGTLYPSQYRQLCGNGTSCQHGYFTALLTRMSFIYLQRNSFLWWLQTKVRFWDWVWEPLSSAAQMWGFFLEGHSSEQGTHDTPAPTACTQATQKYYVRIGNKSNLGTEITVPLGK